MCLILIVRRSAEILVGLIAIETSLKYMLCEGMECIIHNNSVIANCEI